MATAREAFFECSFTAGHRRKTAHVRAWTADEAEQLFREVLAGEGVAEAGTIVVSTDGERHESRLAPRHH